jgi:hypothetical protein
MNLIPDAFRFVFDGAKIMERLLVDDWWRIEWLWFLIKGVYHIE